MAKLGVALVVSFCVMIEKHLGESREIPSDLFCRHGLMIDEFSFFGVGTFVVVFILAHSLVSKYQFA